MRLGLAAAVLLVLAFAHDASACSCLPADLVRDLPRADGAFVGTVLAASPRGRAESVYRFRVEQVYAGEIDSRIEVVSARDSATCGLQLAVGDRTGLLLQRDGQTWRSGLCSQVDAAEFLELTDVDDNSLPPINWGGYVVGFFVLAVGTLLLVRRLRRYRGLR